MMRNSMQVVLYQMLLNFKCYFYSIIFLYFYHLQSTRDHIPTKNIEMFVNCYFHFYHVILRVAFHFIAAPRVKNNCRSSQSIVSFLRCLRFLRHFEFWEKFAKIDLVRFPFFMKRTCRRVWFWFSTLNLFFKIRMIMFIIGFCQWSFRWIL